MVGLAHVDFEPQAAGAVLEHPGDVVERVGAVDVRFAQAKQVQVRAVQDEDAHPIPQRLRARGEPHISRAL